MRNYAVYINDFQKFVDVQRIFMSIGGVWFSGRKEPYCNEPEWSRNKYPFVLLLRNGLMSADTNISWYVNLKKFDQKLTDEMLTAIVLGYEPFEKFEWTDY